MARSRRQGWQVLARSGGPVGQRLVSPGVGGRQTPVPGLGSRSLGVGGRKISLGCQALHLTLAPFLGCCGAWAG